MRVPEPLPNSRYLNRAPSSRRGWIAEQVERVTPANIYDTALTDFESADSVARINIRNKPRISDPCSPHLPGFPSTRLTRKILIRSKPRVGGKITWALNRSRAERNRVVFYVRWSRSVAAANDRRLLARSWSLAFKLTYVRWP